MNHLFAFKKLKNRYFILRHGHSLANQRGIVVSQPAHGINGFGLTATGRDQVHASLSRTSDMGAHIRIFSSDFKRARETAEIAFERFGSSHPIRFETRLRERDFGTYEFAADTVYAEVWRADSSNADHRIAGVESARQVMARATALIAELEQQHADQCLLIVSHGDILQILSTAFARRDASCHRQQAHLHTAEIKPLKLV